MPFSRFNQGRVDDALHWADIAAREAEDAVDKEALALAYTTQSFIYATLGSRGAAIRTASSPCRSTPSSTTCSSRRTA